MAIVPSKFEKCKQYSLTSYLNCCYHWPHSAAVQVKLNWINFQAMTDKHLQVGVELEEGPAVVCQSKPAGSQGGTGEEESLNCSFVGGLCSPTLWQRAEALLVPGDPMTRENLNPVPSGQETGLGGGLLHLPGGGTT